MIYFTADLHLGHNHIIKLVDRDFDNVEQMNETLINNINSLVSNDDTLYLLGDLTHKVSIEEANRLIKRINGKKILIRGNHDKQCDESLFEGIYDYYELNIQGSSYMLMHYPIRSWNKMRRGTFQLHGHIHSKKEYNLYNREKGLYQYDVGVDANDYFPVSVDQILDFFKDVPLIDYDSDFGGIVD